MAIAITGFSPQIDNQRWYTVPFFYVTVSTVSTAAAVTFSAAEVLGFDQRAVCRDGV
jgi:glucose-6-phosphate 1-dehydrogenase